MAERLSAPFVIERTFAAPRALVYAALTEARHLGQWMAPAGMEITQCNVDARPDGVFHYAMKARGFAAAPTMWGKWTFRELDAPQRLVVVVQFSDADGGVTRHPLAAQWPLLTLSTTTLTETAGSTVMHVEWRALDADAGEEAIFNASHAAMTMGWRATMDVLDSYLQQQK
ncbi:SRPBCC family protein [Herbaspirillum sp. alder98]|uniref:SRPBCC family protein n=1 Tax=Herbaspirillum sp. alder98 TaxID=2913096 RepID=UPI001CD86F5E|nr:SRPBCC domain-containing protein [Herbaspirillum sp. alder98]MCA1326032.1 SRPBCC domain-containing protein [Herbaspirillum sp. alder98]